MYTVILWGPIFFGVVVGWITYRTLRRSATSGVSDLATVIGAVGGAAVTGLFAKEAFDFYCLGLFGGFFAYLLVAEFFIKGKDPTSSWMGSNNETTTRKAVSDPGIGRPKG